MFCPDCYTRIKIRDVNPSPPKVVRSSIIITTNLPFSEWPSLFENTAMVVAMIDRLTFKSSQVEHFKIITWLTFKLTNIPYYKVLKNETTLQKTPN